MTQKPAWLTRKIVLQIALAVIAAGLFGPLYTVVEQTIGKDRAAELLQWGISAKDETENPPVSPPEVDIVGTKPLIVDTSPERVDDLDISRAVQVGSNNNLPRLSSIPLTSPCIESARVEGKNVRLAFSGGPPSSFWSSSTDHMKFARGWVFWREGSTVYGSHFDWFRPGQTVKTLGNLYNGYLTRRPTGQLYFCLIANDQSGRTNVKAAQ